MRIAVRLLGVLTAAIAIASAPPAGARTAPSGLVYSNASALAVQPQPAPASCHALGSGLEERPDPRCTPGAVNPAVTQATIGSTICKRGWTATVRPTAGITGAEKLASLRAYAESGPSHYEYDHFVPLELGGAVNDARNLWPEPDYPVRRGFELNPKDALETALKRRVCDGSMSLAAAQRTIAANWVLALARYG